jgi:hypothetical protein
MKSTVFLSYASSLDATAERIELALKGEGYAVFRDRSALPPGEAFDERIRAAIEDSDLFVFLISPDSVTPGRYTLSELKFAEQKWQHPAGRVLPVLVEPTPREAIPAFLRAVSILKPRGNLVAEVAAEVARLTAPWWRRMLEPRRSVPALITVLLIAVGAWLTLPPYLERRQRDAEAAALIERSRSQVEAGDSAEAWKLLEQANAVAPASRAVFQAQEQFAMERLRYAGLNYRSARGSYGHLIEAMLPVLVRGTSDATGERLANLQAHIGWADYLRGGGASVQGMNPADHYRAALEADPANVYAHAMWGFEVLRRGYDLRESLAEAKRHFSAALASAREREYVRTVQVYALLQGQDIERKKEIIRALNAMRTSNDVKPRGWGPAAFKNEVWSMYYFGFVVSNQQALLAALPPDEHLATFRWLFSEDDLPTDRDQSWLREYLFVRAQLEEYAGERAAALASYRRVLPELIEIKSSGNAASSIEKQLQRVEAAIRRLGG